ncbi:hypothetical protein PMAYCL1PPCAC_31752, partial [Pristionchus mayeri]
LLRITYFSNGLLFNFLPSTLLILLSAALIRRIRTVIDEIFQNDNIDRAHYANHRFSARLVYSFLFFPVETTLFTAILNILIVFMAEPFRSEVASSFGPIFMTLIVVSSACNLIIHVSMSRRFREV